MAQANTVHSAICILNPDGGSTVSGVVKFTQVEGQQVTLKGEMINLTPGKHGFHVHVYGKYLKLSFSIVLIIFLSQETSSMDAPLLALTGTPRRLFMVDPKVRSDTMVILAT